jgi:Spy/CpxP family protein refolding chaperone
MTETPTHETPDPSPSASPNGQATPPRRKWRRLFLAGLIGTGLVAAVGATVHAHGGWHHGPGGWHSDMSPEAMQRRIDAGVRWMLADTNASEEQQKRIAEIAAGAMTELRPLRERHREARRKVIEILSQPTVDRAALESLRAEEMQLADQVTKRMTRAMADAAEVLTPEQRLQLAEKMKQRRGWRSG